MSTQSNLQELILEMTQGEDEEAIVSEDLKALLARGLHHVLLPDTLKPKAAEALQLAFEGMGGLPRLIQWADTHPQAFYKLFARMVAQTITPVLPPPPTDVPEDWPPYITAQRLQYRISAPTPTQPNEDTPDETI